MELNKETQELLLAALERQPQRPPLVHAWPGTGMSTVNISLLSRLLEREKKPGERSQDGT